MIEYNEGGNLYPMNLPGRVKYSNIILKRGMTADLELYQWHLSVVNGTVQRKNGSIVLLDRAGNLKPPGDFTQAWPTNATGLSFPHKPTKSLSTALKSYARL